MSKLSRVNQFILGVILILLAAVFEFLEEDALAGIIAILSFSLFLYGIRQIIFYIRMGRHMVGGKRLLYRGIIVTDLALFTDGVYLLNQTYVLLYLVGIQIFSGVVDLARAREAKKLGAPWMRKGIFAMISIVFALAMLMQLKSPMAAVDLYCAGLVVSGVARIASAFRKTAVIYIP